MDAHHHVYKAGPERRWYSHARGMVRTNQAARDWARRNLGGAHFRVFGCDGTECPGGRTIEVMQERARRAPARDRRLSANVRARIRRRADKRGVTPDALVLAALDALGD